MSLFVHLLRVRSTNLTTAGQLDKQTSRPAGLSRLSSVGIGQQMPQPPLQYHNCLNIVSPDIRPGDRAGALPLPCSPCRCKAEVFPGRLGGEGLLS